MIAPDGIFLHLSDIHFEKAGKSPDLDASIRKELLADLRLCAKDLGNPVFDSILVTGDIAFSARADEYGKADKWLKDILAVCRCGPEAVIMVPGNHDVEHGKSHLPISEELQAGLRRSKALPDLDKRLKKYFESDDRAVESLYESFGAYNKFAAAFGCDLSPNKAFVLRDKKLKNGLSVRFIGLNSCLTSNGKDDRQKQKLLLASSALDHEWDDSFVYMSLCHHPTDWIRFQKDVERKLNARFSLQLFGHKHLRKNKLFGKGLLKMFAGAVHPERSKAKRKPSYNLLLLKKNGKAVKKTLNVKIAGRIWNGKIETFGPESASQPWIEYEIALKKRVGLGKHLARPARANVALKSISEEAQTMQITLQDKIPADEYFQFFRLPHTRRKKILIALGVYEDGFKGLPELEVCQRGLLKVIEEGKIAAFKTQLGHQS